MAFTPRGDSNWSFSLGVTAGDDEGVVVVETLGDPDCFDWTGSLRRSFARRGLSTAFSDLALVFSWLGPPSELVAGANLVCFLGVMTGAVCAIGSV